MILKQPKCKICGRKQTKPLPPFNPSHGDETGICHFCFIWLAKEMIKYSRERVPMDDITPGCGEQHPTSLYRCSRPEDHGGGHLAVGIAGLVYEAWDYGKAMLQLSKRRKIQPAEINHGEE